MKSGMLAIWWVAVVAGASAGEVPLVIDEARSRVEIVVQATVDSFVGKLAAYEAAVAVDEASGQVARARFAFHFADVRTGKEARDEAMNEWQDTGHNPDGVFTLAGITTGADGQAVARGRLTLHGMEKELSFPVSVTHDGALYAIDGDATLDTREFGLPIIRKFLLLKVEPEVHVRFHLQGRVKGEGMKG